MNVLNPSSIQAWRRSSEPTIMGNQLWPSSWSTTPNRPKWRLRTDEKWIIGYSMPPMWEATEIATG